MDKFRNHLTDRSYFRDRSIVDPAVQNSFKDWCARKPKLKMPALDFWVFCKKIIKVFST